MLAANGIRPGPPAQSFIDAVRARDALQQQLDQPFAAVQPDGTVQQQPPQNDPTGNAAEFAKLWQTPSEISRAALTDAIDSGTSLVTEPIYGVANLDGNLTTAFQNAFRNPSVQPEPEPLPVDLENRDLSAAHPVLATVSKVGQGMAGSLPLLAVGGGLPAAGSRLLATAFAANSIAHSGEAWQQLGTELGKNPEDRDMDAVTSAWSNILQDSIFDPLSGADGTGTTVGETLFPEREAIERLSQQLRNGPVNVGNWTWAPAAQPFIQPSDVMLSETGVSPQYPFGQGDLLHGGRLMPPAWAGGFYDPNDTPAFSIPSDVTEPSVQIGRGYDLLAAPPTSESIVVEPPADGIANEYPFGRGNLLPGEGPIAEPDGVSAEADGVGDGQTAPPPDVMGSGLAPGAEAGAEDDTSSEPVLPQTQPQPFQPDAGTTVPPAPAVSDGTGFGEVSEDAPPDNNVGSGWQSIAEQLAQRLEGLKSGIGQGGQLHALGIVPDLWDRAVTVAQMVIRGGGTTADAINAAINHVRSNFAGKFNETAARRLFAQALLRTATQPGRIDPLFRSPDKALDASQSGRLPVNSAVGSVAEQPWGEKIKAGNAFNRDQRRNYRYNELYIKGEGTYYRLDSYDPQKGEIVSRKFTQFSNIRPNTALRYLNELPKKYRSGSVIADVPSSKELAGKKLRGQMILEVPSQKTAIPPDTLAVARKMRVQIRDINGKVH